MTIQRLIIVVLAVCVFSPGNVFAEVFIRQFKDLVKEHQQAAWNHKSGALIDSKSSQLGVVELKSKVFTEGEMFGETVEFLQMKAKPVAGQKEFGVQGSFVYDLPEGQYFQFQGFVEIPQVNQNPASVMVQVSTLQDGGWKVAQVFKGLESGIIEEENIKYVQFVLDLSKWAGQQVQLELVLNANASYMNVNGQEQWTPNEVTCNWNKASVVASSFGIKLGEPEKVEKIPAQQAFSTSQYSTNQVDDIIIRSEYTVLDGVKGSPSGDSQMENPAESGVNTTYIPAGGGYPGRFVAYLTSRVYGPPTGVTAKAYPRLIDFAGTSLNMANASPQQVQNNVYEISGAAKEVITPGSTYNDELPSHVAFASVVSSFLGGGSTPLLNAFMHTEDVYQFDQGSANPNDARYTRIGYARSIASQHNFGRQFAKTNYSGNVNPIIRYFKDEQDIIMDGKLWGVGDPTVIEANDGYYYMIYTTRALIVYNPGAPDPYLNSNGKYGNKAGLSIAIALKSSVDSGNYGNNSNPWKKFKQVTSNVMDSANWVEPGYGGAESILWNYIEDSNGYRTQEVKHAPKWRAFSKVSFNPFLAEETTDTALLICKGGWVVQEPHPKGIIIHTSNNLIDWGGENDYLIVMTDDSAPVSGDYYYYEYPTLIGRDVVLGDGYSAHTTEENYLYYQKDKITVGIGGIVDHDLVRRSLTILK